MSRFRHYVLPAWWWDSYGWRDRLKLRWGAFRLGALVKPDRNCPPEYAHLFNLDRQHFVPLGVDTEESHVEGF